MLTGHIAHPAAGLRDIRPLRPLEGGLRTGGAALRYLKDFSFGRRVCQGERSRRAATIIEPLPVGSGFVDFGAALFTRSRVSESAPNARDRASCKSGNAVSYILLKRRKGRREQGDQLAKCANALFASAIRWTFSRLV